MTYNDEEKEGNFDKLVQETYILTKKHPDREREADDRRWCYNGHKDRILFLISALIVGVIIGGVWSAIFVPTECSQDIKGLGTFENGFETEGICKGCVRLTPSVSD